MAVSLSPLLRPDSEPLPSLERMRRILQEDHEQVLDSLRAGRDRLHAELGQLDESSVKPALLGYDVLIALGEREDFLTMESERIEVVLLQMEQRLKRLGELIRESQVLMEQSHLRLGAEQNCA